MERLPLLNECERVASHTPMCPGRNKPPDTFWRLLERETGFESATHCLGISSPAMLRPVASKQQKSGFFVVQLVRLGAYALPDTDFAYMATHIPPHTCATNTEQIGRTHPIAALQYFAATP